MPRRVFYSFHYAPDCWRASQVRNIGAIDSNQPASDNDWEAITRGGDVAIQRWIDGQLTGRSCTVVLIGANTAGRKWIGYEIKRSWELGKGLLGIHIHNLLDRNRYRSVKGTNPFASFSLGSQPLASIVHTYDPPGADSTAVYSHIRNNLAAWIDLAVAIRSRYS